MPSQVHQRGPTTPRMNITPLIDVVFLLILFFMLTSNIVAEEAAPMLVPSVREAQTRELKRQRVVVNVLPRPFRRDRLEANPLLHSDRARGVKVGALRTFAMDELDQVTAALERVRRRRKGRIQVLLRADAALAYREVRPVMQAITAANVRKVHLVAYLPGEGPSGESPRINTDKHG